MNINDSKKTDENTFQNKSNTLSIFAPNLQISTNSVLGNNNVVKFSNL